MSSKSLMDVSDPDRLKVRVRNRSYMPDLGDEGVFICPMPKPPMKHKPGQPWHTNLKTHERLFYHQTMNSVRASKRFRASPLIPKDVLEQRLYSRYDQSTELFPDPVDVVLQAETCLRGRVQQTFRALKNTIVKTHSDPIEFENPLRIGGIKRKYDPNKVDLIPQGPHAQAVNNGYSRQESDGNFFRY